MTNRRGGRVGPRRGSGRMIIIGIDPGLNGGVAYIGRAGTLHVHDMPVFMVERGGRKKREVAAQNLVIIIEGYQPIDLCVLERVGAMPKQGVVGMFSFGKPITHPGIRRHIVNVCDASGQNLPIPATDTGSTNEQVA